MSVNFVMLIIPLHVEALHLPWPSPQHRIMRLNFPLPSSTKFLVYLRRRTNCSTCIMSHCLCYTKINKRFQRSLVKNSQEGDAFVTKVKGIRKCVQNVLFETLTISTDLFHVSVHFLHNVK